MYSCTRYYVRNALVALVGLGLAYLIGTLLVAPAWWYLFDGRQLYQSHENIEMEQIRAVFEAESLWIVGLTLLIAAVWLACGVLRSGRRGDGVRSWWMWLLLALVAAAAITSQGLASNLEAGKWWAAGGSVLISAATFWMATLFTAPQTRRFSAPLAYHVRGIAPW